MSNIIIPDILFYVRGKFDQTSELNKDALAIETVLADPRQLEKNWRLVQNPIVHPLEKRAFDCYITNLHWGDAEAFFSVFKLSCYHPVRLAVLYYFYLVDLVQPGIESIINSNQHSADDPEAIKVLNRTIQQFKANCHQINVARDPIQPWLRIFQLEG